MFFSARAPGFDDCRDDGSLDEFPHLHFQQQQHSLCYRHLAADPQTGFRAGADDCGQVLTFLCVLLLSSCFDCSTYILQSGPTKKKTSAKNIEEEHSMGKSITLSSFTSDRCSQRETLC